MDAERNENTRAYYNSPPTTSTLIVHPSSHAPVSTLITQRTRMITRHRQTKSFLWTLCGAVALSLCLYQGQGLNGEGKRGKGLFGDILTFADALPAPAAQPQPQPRPPQPYHTQQHQQQVFLVASEKDDQATFTADAGATKGDDADTATAFRVLLEKHPAQRKHKGEEEEEVEEDHEQGRHSSRHSSGHHHQDHWGRHDHVQEQAYPATAGQNRLETDQQHQDFLIMAARVSGKSPTVIDQEMQRERAIQRETQQRQLKELLLRKQKPKQRKQDVGDLEVEEDDNAKEEEGHRHGQHRTGKGRRGKGRIHGKSAGRIRLPTDVTQPSKKKDSSHHGHYREQDDEEAEKAEEDDEEERDQDEDYEDERDQDENKDEDEEETLARRPQGKSMTSKKSSFKHQQHGDSKRSSNGEVEYQFRIQKTTPTIFYVPHQDDDALAMALAIREHIETGRKVIVHLYSDGINALLRDIVAGAVPCPLAHPPHKFNLTLQDVVTGRTHEFRQSLRALGVQDQDIFETGWSDIEPLKDYEAFQSKLKDLILGYEKMHPGASHKCISGEYDRDSVGRNPTHRACWDVATRLLNEYPKGWPDSRQLWDFRFYRTYTYYNAAPKRSAQFIRALPQHLPFKQKALDQYKRWDPKRGELAWGYHSVKPLIDAAYQDPHVYMDMLDNDPTNPKNWYAPSVNSKEHGKSMFPDIWKSNNEKDWNQALIQAQVEAQVQQLQQQQKQHQQQEQQDHNHHNHSGKSEYDDEEFDTDEEEGDRSFVQDEEKVIDMEEMEDINGITPATKWDSKEEAMREQVLAAFEKAAQGPEAGSYCNRTAILNPSDEY